MKTEKEDRFYEKDNGEKLTIRELLRSEWAKANELLKPMGWRRMFSRELDLLSFVEGFNAGMKHSIDIQNNRIKVKSKLGEQK